MNDDELREFFHRNRPALSDEEKYLSGLNARLDSIEEIKRIHDAGVARCRKLALYAFVCGVALGVVVLTFILWYPVPASQLSITLPASVALFVEQWKEMIMALIALTALTLGLIPWTNWRRA